VKLDTSKLLQCMIEQATSVISCIVEMTNVLFSLSLPSSLDEAQDAALSSVRLPTQDGSPRTKRKERSHLLEPDAAVVSPSISPMVDCEVLEDFYLDDDQETERSMELSAERCEHLVDFLLNETPHSILSLPSSRKKAKVGPSTA
jgi:hypothetical protein